MEFPVETDFRNGLGSVSVAFRRAVFLVPFAIIVLTPKERATVRVSGIARRIAESEVLWQGGGGPVPFPSAASTT